MKTEPSTTKGFKSVSYMRKERDRISKEIQGMTAKQELEYFRRKAREFREKS
jgi:hypothetical protein